MLSKDQGESKASATNKHYLYQRTPISDASSVCAADGMHNAHECWKNASLRTVTVIHPPNTTGFTCKNNSTNDTI